MRVLLDESLPRQLADELPGHDVRTVPQVGWSGTKNGALLQLAATRFDVFLTADKGFEHQQDRNALPLAVIILKAKTNRRVDLLPLVEALREALGSIQPRTLAIVSAPSAP